MFDYSRVQIKQELQVIDSFASSWETDLRELPSEDESHIEYHPKEYFEDTFQERIDTMLKEALIECSYENLTTARFNMKDFDIEINGHKKADVNGQGYCSFLNSVVAVVFRSYMEKYAQGLLFLTRRFSVLIKELPIPRQKVCEQRCLISLLIIKMTVRS